MEYHRQLLIVFHLAIGMSLIGASFGCAIAFIVCKNEILMMGAIVAFIMTYVPGIAFCNRGLDPNLWLAEPRRSDGVSNLPQYPDERIRGESWQP